MEIVKNLNWKNILIALSIVIMTWIIFAILNNISQSKEDVIKSFVGEWVIYSTDKIPKIYTLNNNEIYFTISHDEKEINKYYKKNEVKPAGIHILKGQSKDITLFEVCGFDGLEISSYIAFGNFDLDKDKEILLVYCRDILNRIGKYSVVDYTDGKIHINPVDDNTLVGQYIIQYFKSTYFIGFTESFYASLSFYVSIFISIIISIYILFSIRDSIKSISQFDS